MIRRLVIRFIAREYVSYKEITMPTLDWIGKDKVINHHLEVPYRVLNRVYSYDERGQHEEDNGSENMIIHGDNLEALKSLLPQYEGRIDCIYIDPPYNTGNEGWIYNDSVNDPQIKKWLGEVVGRESEDLTRHDKWLCMMYPRLRLLQKLLSDNGVLFISIDNVEISNLKLLCDEIFGVNNFIDIISWFKKASPSNDAQYFSNDIEYILIYAKDKKQWKPKRLPLTDEQLKNYRNPDNDPRGPWNSATYTCNKSKEARPSLFYPIINPYTGQEVWPKETAVWAYSKEQCEDHIKNNLLFWGVDGKAQYPRFKKFLSGHQGVVNRTLWHYDDVGHTQGASGEVKLFDIGIFDTPKPTRLIERIIRIATGPSSIILDSFSGSGTTAQAVLNVNKSDHGSRRFILVEMMDYADSITAKRVKKVITGYSKDEKFVLFDEEITAKNLSRGKEILDQAKRITESAKNSGEYTSIKQPKVENGHLRVVALKKAEDQEPGIPGNFSFYELGEPLMEKDSINESIPVQKIREYVYFTETKSKLASDADEYYLGTSYGCAYYFYYNKDETTTLNRDFLQKIKVKSESYVIYADVCTLSDKELEKYHITFKKIPRDITRF